MNYREETMSGVQGIDFVELRQNMATSFSVEELDILCFDLGIESSDVSGPGLQMKVIQIIGYCQRRGPLLFDLLTYCEKARPHLQWRQDIQAQPSSVDTVENRIEHRNQLYEASNGVQLVHTMAPSKHHENYWDILVYLTRHQSDDLSVVDYAEFFFGKYWGNEIFKVPKQDDFVGVLISAYGPALCTCRIVFTDRQEVMLNRYIDFEMTSLISQPKSEKEPEEGIPSSHRINPAKLARLINDNFHHMEAIDMLAYELELGTVRFGELPGESRRQKAYKLVRYAQNRDRLPELLRLLQQRQPDIQWESETSY
jgi:hypothetical protein